MSTKEKIFKDLDHGMFPKMRHIDLMVLFYYMGRLKELGLIDGGSVNVTTKGFDVALDIIEQGWELTSDDIIELLILSDLASDEIAIGIAHMIIELQTVGYDAMKKMVSDMLNSEKP